MKYKINVAIMLMILGFTGCASPSDVLSETPSSDKKIKSKTTEEQIGVRNYETVEKKMNKASELRLINSGEKPVVTPGE